MALEPGNRIQGRLLESRSCLVGGDGNLARLAALAARHPDRENAVDEARRDVLDVHLVAEGDALVEVPVETFAAMDTRAVGELRRLAQGRESESQITRRYTVEQHSQQRVRASE